MTKNKKKKDRAIVKKNKSRHKPNAVATRNPREEMARFTVQSPSPFNGLAPADINNNDKNREGDGIRFGDGIQQAEDDADFTEFMKSIKEYRSKLPLETYTNAPVQPNLITETHYFCYVPEIHIENGLIPNPYIRLCELPEKMQEVFVPWIKNSSRPYIRDHHDAVYYRDFKRWFEDYTDRIYIEKKNQKEEEVKK